MADRRLERPWVGHEIPNCGRERYAGVIIKRTLYLDEFSQAQLCRQNLQLVREQNAEAG